MMRSPRFEWKTKNIVCQSGIYSINENSTRANSTTSKQKNKKILKYEQICGNRVWELQITSLKSISLILHQTLCRIKYK